jgi:predicted N-formylglutamate amidohydrolase
MRWKVASRSTPEPAARMTVLVTCEHGGNRVPATYRPLFRRHEASLVSHRGYDPGALRTARDFAEALGAELVYSTTTRLLVELNRSPHHRQLFSEITRPLPLSERERLLARYYFPYREWVEAQVRASAESGRPILHLSSHTFTPSLNGVERKADVGLLYDPRREAEVEFCEGWQAELKALAPHLIVRRNYPYRGSDDGLTTYLRKRYPEPAYAGIELEVNQRHVLGDPRAWQTLRKHLVVTFRQVLARAASKSSRRT